MFQKTKTIHKKNFELADTIYTPKTKNIYNRTFKVRLSAIHLENP